MKRRIFAAFGALAIASILMLAFVLPAEYDLDPLGTGAILGLLGLSGQTTDTSRAILAPMDSKPVRDVRTYSLPPFASVEFKYDLAEGAVMIYEWESTAEVVFDFHAEPTIGGEAATQSFSQGRTSGESGSYIAPFDGIHGWFWENRSLANVTVVVKTNGFMTGGTEYRDNDKIQVQIGE